jgi:transcriptional regulator with XRE-family HTH domain
MKPSSLRHPVAILRQICGLYQKEFADLIGCSRIYLQKIEQTPQHGGQRLSENLATRIFHETGISLAWLLAGDPKVPPVSRKGEPYTHQIYERVQAEKKWYDQPQPYFRLNSSLGFCAQLVAILESANAEKKYFMAEYKVGKALESLRNEFGQDPQIYPETTPRAVMFYPALKTVGKLLDHGQKQIDEGKQQLAEIKAERKRSSSQQRKKKRA